MNNNDNARRVYEIGIVYKRPLFESMVKISSSQDTYTFLKESVDMETIDLKEFFWVILLNRANSTLGFSEIAKGDTSGVVVNVKEIFQLALMVNATSIIICHNHPSGNLKASKTDYDITEKTRVIAELFSMKLLDHLILTSESYYSFADEGDI